MKKDLRNEAIAWVLVMVAASALAFGMLRRDAERSFGAVAFGSVPPFRLATVGKGFADEHLIRGHVWAVHTAQSNSTLMVMAGQLTEISKRTASGKRQLYVLSVSDAISPDLSPLIPSHYIVLANAQERSALLGVFGNFSKDTVMLVDQNGVVRGKYDFADIQGFKDFQRNMMRLL